MFQSNESDAQASTLLPTPTPKHEPQHKKVRHLLFGEPDALQLVINTLHVLGYTEATAWSKPQPTSTPGEVVRVLFKTVLID
ncbi:hypothetical protein [Pseudanabaena sp. FACHB-2040]|uniref:hypothetical protein n=1 Tax=Pseudanabaena sp. FACHB-2040 TaxID=2692859 RepID=UPI0016891A53|nr:hypothetical protein [Pseudanabaena sp. FACHB-2040]MBD2259743.1 hypothetical protein [Pseudanabaena sp. FACHB-2040]